MNTHRPPVTEKGSITQYDTVENYSWTLWIDENDTYFTHVLKTIC